MTIELCLSIIGAVTGVIGTAIGISGIMHNRFLAVNQYMEALEEKDFIDARARIYNWTANQPIPIDNKDASIIVNFFITGDYLQKSITCLSGYLIQGLGAVLFGCMILQRDILWSEEAFIKTPCMQISLNGYITN